MASRNYAHSGLREPKNSMSKKTAKEFKPVDPFENGGLDEDDADATRPAFEPKPPAFEPKPFVRHGEYHERDPRRRNNVCDM
jgi:hypothetical protein